MHPRMTHKSAVVVMTRRNLRLLGYGDSYEIESFGSGGHTTFIQGADADALKNALATTPDEYATLNEWYHA